MHEQNYMSNVFAKQFLTVTFLVCGLPAQWSRRVSFFFFIECHKVQSYSCQRWESSHGRDLLPQGGKHYSRTLDTAERNAVQFLKIDSTQMCCARLDFLAVTPCSLRLFRRSSAKPFFCLHLFAL